MIKELCIILILSLTGCAYMGMHGKSIHNYPGIHDGAVEDSQCLSCHDPAANPVIAPVSPHPKFTGCLKCHNDEF